MLGLGETEGEIFEAARDLREAGCDILTVGQYLAPGGEYLKVEKYFSPEYFAALADQLKVFEFRNIFAGPYVRSSYHAGEVFSRQQLSKGGKLEPWLR